jgi:hypothetical protein
VWYSPVICAPSSLSLSLLVVVIVRHCSSSSSLVWLSSSSSVIIVVVVIIGCVVGQIGDVAVAAAVHVAASVLALVSPLVQL